MSPRILLGCSLVLPALLGLAPAASAAEAARAARAVQSDLAPTEARQLVLDLAAKFSHPSEPVPLAAGLKSPFDFDKAEPDPTPMPGNPSQPAPAKDARDILETLAPMITPTGTIMLFGRPPILVFGSRNVKVGGKLTITFENNDYELELVGATSTSFTLRYKDQETTRPIKTGK